MRAGGHPKRPVESGGQLPVKLTAVSRGRGVRLPLTFVMNIRGAVPNTTVPSACSWSLLGDGVFLQNPSMLSLVSA
eukprot:7902352-Prorocentrum_lima.AAC.1